MTESKIENAISAKSSIPCCLATERTPNCSIDSFMESSTAEPNKFLLEDLLGDFYPELIEDILRNFSCQQQADDELFFMGTEPISANRKSPVELCLSEKAHSMLKQIEGLHLNPYDDQTGQGITARTAGATIGYGHLIDGIEWTAYKNGISEPDADTLFESDLSPFVTAVRDNITAELTQNEFDALVILAFNIGLGKDGFGGSSVVKLINDPGAVTPYKDLETAWKAWNKSQGKVMKGLENRRQCEWNIYSKGTYKRW